MKRTAKPVQVAVVGGGPAGMEAARIATERGHLVTLFEQAGELGGALKYVCLVPGKEKMRWYLDWVRDQLVELNVDVRLNHAPTVDELGEFDVVLNATGARSYVPEVAGDASRVIPFEDAMACPKVACECYPGGRRLHKLGARVLLWGDSYAATDTAAFLANIGKQVTIVTENPEFAADCEVIHMYVLRKRFAQGDAEVLESRPYPHPVTVLTEHDRGGDPARRGRPAGQGLRAHDAGHRRCRDVPHAAGGGPPGPAPRGRRATSSTSATRSDPVTCTTR